MDWRDLRIALALERHQSLAAAGRALGVDPTTVGRRISALEAGLGAPLFVRAGDGWRPTEAGRRVVGHAAEMARQVRALGHAVDAVTGRVQGVVRLTTIEFIAAFLLAPAVSRLRAHHPDLVLDLVCTNATLDLAAGQADVAVRAVRPTEASLRVRRLAEIQMGLYGARALLDGLDGPLTAAPVVTLGPPDAPVAETQWLRRLVPDGPVTASTTSPATLFELVRRGAGVGVLPVSAADGRRSLVRLDEGAPPMSRALWRVVPPELADTPRVRAVLDWLDEVVGGRDSDPPAG